MPTDQKDGYNAGDASNATGTQLNLPDKLSCKYCGSSALAKAGFQQGHKPRYYCKTCKRTFVFPTTTSHICKNPIEKQRVYDLHTREHISRTKLAHLFHCRITTITDILEEFGIPRRKHHRPRRIWDKAELRRLYWDEKLSLTRIGQIYNATPTTVKQAMQRFNIERRSLSEANSGELSRRWKGGRRIEKDGYVGVTVPSDSFFASMRGAAQHYIPEHRLIMAKHLNRCLLPWEVIHHRNGVKGDNRLENLKLLPGGQYHIIDRQTKDTVRRLQRQVRQLQSQMLLLVSLIPFRTTQHKHDADYPNKGR